MRLPTVLSIVWLAGTACAAQQPPSRFTHAGVIEGFYGAPWSHQDRLDLLRFMGRVGLNTYVYAPKDDPYHRERWRERYPPAEAARLRQLVDSARAAGVSLWYAVSPGGSIGYADSADYAALLTKLAAVRDVGVTTFGLFLDDVPTTLTHEGDRRAFGSLAAAHVSLINRLARDVEAWADTLVVTPTTYTDAWGDREYLAEVGRGANPGVSFFWTGPDVASPTITAADGERWRTLLGRPMLLWDNYPVNDYARWRVFLGPFRGRAADLASSVAGIIANPINQAHASMVPLATLADYARDPAGYDPDASWRNALRTLYGDSAARMLTPFLETYGDYGWDANLMEALFILGDTIQTQEIAARLDALDRAVTVLQGLSSAGSEPLAPLVGDLAPVVTQTRARLATLRTDTSYRVAGGALVYRGELDRYEVEGGAAVTVDGRLDEWAGARWHPLRNATHAGGRAAIAFRHAADLLYLALRVRDASPVFATGLDLAGRDHIQVVVATDPRDAPRGLTPSDLIAVVGETSGFVDALDFKGFMSKWLADDRDLGFSAFILSTFARPHPDRARVAHAGTRIPGGYAVEMALPRGGRDSLRMSVRVRDAGRDGGTSALPLRNYPGNPATFVRAVFR